MKKLFLLTIIIACLVGNTALAQRADYNIIPLPKQVETDTTQYFTLQTGMGIAYDASS
jgi:spermidine/putrescine-binding protein